MVPTVSMLGYRVVSGSCDVLCDELLKRLTAGERRITVQCINPHSVAVAERDPVFKDALTSADYLIPDGIGVVLACRLLGQRVAERVTGTDLYVGMMNRLQDRDGAKVFYLGSSDVVLMRLVATTRLHFGNRIAVSTLSPPFVGEFNDIENAEMVSRINSFCPNLLWVGMTAPKQEKWIANNIESIECGVAAGIGAVFDFASESRRRAPKIIRRVGLEWLYRLVGEPRRLWRRTIVSGVVFSLLVVSGLFVKWNSRATS